MPKISAVVQTYNEKEMIAECLESLKWADEIIVVDSSNDGTFEIAKRFTDKVIFVDPIGIVEPIRQFGIDKASGDWIAIVDADEKFPGTLVDKLREIIQHSDAEVIRMPRKNLIFGKWIRHTLWWPDYQYRFFKKGALTWGARIHTMPDIKGKILELPAQEKYAIYHLNYKDRPEFFRRMRRITTIEAKQMFERKERTNLFRMAMEMAKEFARRLIKGQAYLDGIIGIELCIYMTIYRFLCHYKLMRLQKGKPVNYRP